MEYFSEDTRNSDFPKTCDRFASGQFASITFISYAHFSPLASLAFPPQVLCELQNYLGPKKIFPLWLWDSTWWLHKKNCYACPNSDNGTINVYNYTVENKEICACVNKKNASDTTGTVYGASALLRCSRETSDTRNVPFEADTFVVGALLPPLGKKCWREISDVSRPPVTYYWVAKDVSRF